MPMSKQEVIDYCDKMRAQAEGVGLSDCLVGLIELAYNKGKARVSESNKINKEPYWEILFGDDAVNRDFSEEEALQTLREFSDKAFKYDELIDCGDTEAECEEAQPVKKFYEAEVFVRAQYRHKIFVQAYDGDDIDELVIKCMESEPMDAWCSEESREGWNDNPMCKKSSDQYEVANIIEVNEAGEEVDPFEEEEL